ncbi:MAG: glycosyltransferase family 2 protein [Bacteroidota bacterium]|nr:glycosyltransferase family 2 protein [Bacteroidota bacterium]
MIKNSKVAIIIVNWKKYNMTANCVESVIKCNYPNYEIILVDNESDTSKVSIFKSRKNLKTILNSKNEGFSKANNQGIEYALKNNFDYILLLNNDTVIKSNLIDILIKTLQAKKVYAIQPLILNHKRKKIWSGGGKINYFFGTFSSSKKACNSFKLIEWFTGCCCLFDSKLFIDIGKFDERFFAYYEDVDFSLRMKKNGYKIGFTPQTELIHMESASSKLETNKEGVLSPNVHYLNIKNHIFVLRKHSKIFNPIGTVFYQIFKIFSYTTYFILRFRFTKLRMVYKGLKDSFKTQI